MRRTSSITIFQNSILLALAVFFFTPSLSLASITPLQSEPPVNLNILLPWPDFTGAPNGFTLIASSTQTINQVTLWACSNNRVVISRVRVYKGELDNLTEVASSTPLSPNIFCPSNLAQRPWLITGDDYRFTSPLQNSVEITQGERLTIFVDFSPYNGGHLLVGAHPTRSASDFITMGSTTAATIIPPDPRDPSFPSFELAFDDGCVGECVSNVLFFPGTMGSRLFEHSSDCGVFNNEKERWVSTRDCDHERLTLDATGKSMNPLYTKEGEDGAIDDAYSLNMYQSFMDDLDTWKNDDHLIADYAIVPYDWRLSLDDILNNGAASSDGELSYGTSQGFFSAYIYKKLTELAASSRTGKVTIIGHSNGGLVTKALIQKLKENNDPLYDKIDNVIFVAVPQSGTPEAVANMLHGTNIGPLGFVMENERLRDLTQNMPGAYHLLPSQSYFSGEGASVTTSVVKFQNGTATQAFISAYGNEITNVTDITRFLLGEEGRITPLYDDLENPTILRPNLLAYAEDVHQQIDDSWEFSTSTKIYQIAGWGEDTLASIDYRSVRDCKRVDEIVIQGRVNAYCGLWGSKLTFDPIEVIDGDGTVVVPSALAMSTSSEMVKRYWVNLKNYNNDHNIAAGFGLVPFVHKNILEVSELRTLLSHILTGTSSQLDYISTAIPAFDGNTPRLTFTLHSPLTLEFTDTEGRHIGLSTSTPNEVDTAIPGARYERYGEVQVLSIPKTATGTLVLRGVTTGSFTLDIKEQNGNTTIATTSFEGIPSATSTVVTMNIVPTHSVTASSTLVIDHNGDGTTDLTLEARENTVVTLPPSTPMDTTAPEALITFSTSTNAIIIQGIDDTGTTTLTSTTTYPVLKKNQKQHNGIATTTVTIRDMAGNTTLLTYTEKLPSPERRDMINLISITYNGATSSIPSTLRYKWNTKPDGAHKLFATYFATSTMVIESHWRPKKNITVIMQKPVEDDGADTDDDVDARPVKMKLNGFIVPTLKTNQGKINVTY